MFTMDYWRDQAETIMEDYNPSLYRKLKKTGKLEERIESLAKMSLMRMEHTYDLLKKQHLPKDSSLPEITTTEYENQTAAREIAQQELEETIMSM